MLVETRSEALPAEAAITQKKTHKEDKKRDDNALFLIHQCVNFKVFEKIVG